MGRPRTVSDTRLLAGMATVFRTEGYEGASLSSLAAAAGVQPASLYHRHPGGKRDIALAVLDDVGRQFAEILEPLSAEARPIDGVAEMARRVAEFYADGRLACALETMTLGGAPDAVRERAARLALGWIEAMSTVAVRAGSSETEARRRAIEAFTRIEGSLVLARVVGDPDAFATTLAGLPRLLTGTGEDA